jgi:ribosome-associated heat shock protein Hsp15
MSNPAQSSTQVRLDKWLWAARFYKTRSLARDQIDGGKVHYNGQRTKPGKAVEVGAWCDSGKARTSGRCGCSR